MRGSVFIGLCKAINSMLFLQSVAYVNGGGGTGLTKSKVATAIAYYLP